MLRIRQLLLAGLFSMLIAGTANAQSSGFGIGAHYSWVRNQETEEGTSMIGAMARMRGQVVGVEGAIDYRNDDLGGDVKMKTWPVTASLMIFPIPVVYGLAGLGWYNSTITSSLFDDQTDSQLGYHFGAGVEVPVAKTIRLTGDIRYLFVDYEFDDIPSTIGKVDADALSLNGGLIFYLK